MEKFFNLILIAFVIEGIVTYVKTWFVDGNFKWQQLATVAIGILLTVAYNIDLIAVFGVESSIPFLGNVLTGVLASRGSNFLFDFIESIMSYTEENEDVHKG